MSDDLEIDELEAVDFEDLESTDLLSAILDIIASESEA